MSKHSEQNTIYPSHLVIEDVQRNNPRSRGRGNESVMIVCPEITSSKPHHGDALFVESRKLQYRDLVSRTVVCCTHYADAAFDALLPFSRMVSRTVVEDSMVGSTLTPSWS